MDYGQPAEACAETGADTGVFKREYPKASVTWDCNTHRGSIHLGHLQQKTDDTSATSAEDSAEVVIVGAGVAGLTAAFELIADGVPGHDIVVLEQRAQPGGREHGAVRHHSKLVSQRMLRVVVRSELRSSHEQAASHARRGRCQPST